MMELQPTNSSATDRVNECDEKTPLQKIPTESLQEEEEDSINA